MHFSIRHFLIKLLHAFLWCVTGTFLLLGVALCLLAYGVDGSHVQPFIDQAIPRSAGKLTVGHVSFLPGRGLVIKQLSFRNAEGKQLVRFTKGIAGLRLFTKAPLTDRITSLQIEHLYVAQIEHDPDKPPSRIDDIHDPFPDLSGVVLPKFDQIPMRLIHPDVLEVRLNEITGTLQTQGGTLLFRDLKGEVDGQHQKVDARIDVDLHGGTVSARIRGFIIQTRLNGIYRALNFPIIERYSNKFTLEQPAWADCTFIVGFDKYRNIFDLKVDISAKRGAYCNVPFDEARGTIHCHGIWDAVTTVDPISVRRNGKVVAEGKLRFDCPNDRFEFEAEGTGITPKEALQLIDMPFTEAIPPMSAAPHPHISIKGSIPLLTEQTPGKVQLTGRVSSEAPFTFDKLQLAAVDTRMKMSNGIFHLEQLSAQMPLGGTMKGNVAIAIPDTATYTDISAHVTLDAVALADLLQPFGMNTLTNCVATGTVALDCRTDETFLSSIQSTYDITIDGGLIGRVPLFAGFTDIIADSIPGISTLTDTSIAKLKGLARDGHFDIPHFTLSGGLFMIEGPVTYDLPEDRLDAHIIAGVFKKDTLIGNLTRWATLPVTKLLWEIHVTGPIGNPQWHNLTLVEKIWDKVPFTGGKEKH